MLQSQNLRVDQEKEPCIGFTQENLIENSVQDCLSYILLCYDSKLKVLSNETTLVLSNIRELDRVPSTE